MVAWQNRLDFLRQAELLNALQEMKVHSNLRTFVFLSLMLWDFHGKVTCELG